VLLSCSGDGKCISRQKGKEHFASSLPSFQIEAFLDSTHTKRIRSPYPKIAKDSTFSD
jgi:hypothetical protein